MDIHTIKQDFDLYFSEVVEYLHGEYDKIRSGRVNPNIFANVFVMAYGVPNELKHIANIQVVDARTVFIKPYDKGLIEEISAAILKANLGVNPIPDSDFLKLIFPPITEDARRMNVKKCKEILEQAKTKTRSIREEIRNEIKKAEGVSEDLTKNYLDEVDKLTKQKNLELEEIFNKKQSELLKI